MNRCGCEDAIQLAVEDATGELESKIEELEAEVERLTNQIGTWRGHTEETYTELLDVAKAEIDQRRAEVERRREWFASSAYKSPNSPRATCPHCEKEFNCAHMEERDQLRAEIERLKEANTIEWTLNEMCEPVPNRRVNALREERDQLRAEVERLKVENGGAAWCMEWLVAEKFRKPDVPGIIKQSQKHYIKTLRENYRLRALLDKAVCPNHKQHEYEHFQCQWCAAVDALKGEGDV